MKNFPYWLEVPIIEGEKQNHPQECGIVIVGSGLTGVSCGYWLQKAGFEDIVIIDDEPSKAASFRNCGHILYGTVESMKAFSEIHGPQKAKDLWAFSIDLCNQVEETVKTLGLEADYKRDGYLVIAIDQSEDRECQESVKLLNSFGFESEYYGASEVKKLGFKNTFGARYERGSAQAHPTKFRNGLMKEFLKNGGKYYSGINAKNIREASDGVILEHEHGQIKSEALVIAASAYSPLFSDFFNARRLVEPFRGQIITSKPLKHGFKIKYPHSFDHGYEYALVTEDNRLMIGGWRNHSPTKELNTYDLTPNDFISQGLQDFVNHHYEIEEKISWEYVWTGIMDASQTSLPFIGPTNSDRVFSCAGYTGHGFSWAHGSAKLLADIMSGADVPDLAKHFNPKAIK